MSERSTPLVPQGPGFRSVKQLYRRMTEDNEVSIKDGEVPEWQRQLVWSSDDQGLLALSILQGYPIGLIVLWKKPNGVRVPIDGRQRLNAIERFMSGEVALPTLAAVPDKLQGSKYTLRAEDDPATTRVLSPKDKDNFEDYELTMVEYGPDSPLDFLADVFVRLQGGKALTKTEVRGALGGRVCEFVTELTSPAQATLSDDEEGADEEPVAHPFFKLLARNLSNTRKAHRNVCDVLLSEYLEPGADKHWSSLEQMYREKAKTLKDTDRSAFRQALTQFMRACTTTVKDQSVLMPQLRTAFLILTLFRAWRELTEKYALGKDFSFDAAIGEFETERQKHKGDVPWVNFTAALSNAGYARNRINERHQILMSWLLQRFPDLKLKDDQRLFTADQKMAIWFRADKRCEWPAGCPEEFPDFKDADADHVVRWTDGGPTTVSNGRLLCKKHNRAPRPAVAATQQAS